MYRKKQFKKKENYMEFEPKIHIAIRIGKKLAIRYSVTDTNSKKIHIKKKAFIMQIT